MSTPTLATETSAADDTTVRERRRQYAFSFARNVLGRGNVILKPDLADRISHTLARTEEVENSIRDEWGNWEYRFSERGRAGAPAIPWLEELVLDSVRSPTPTAHVEPTWPQGRAFALCLTHDVDGVSSRNHEK